MSRKLQTREILTDLRIYRVLALVSSWYSVPARRLCSPVVCKGLRLPRAVAMFILHRVIELSLPAIARVFHKRDHTTVRTAVMKVETLLESAEFDSPILQNIQTLLELVHQDLNHSAAAAARPHFEIAQAATEAHQQAAELPDVLFPFHIIREVPRA